MKNLPTIDSLIPHSMEANSDDRAFKRALTIFKEASYRVPAYNDFLNKYKIKADKIKTKSDFSQVPLVDKVNYISQYGIEDLSWDGVLASTKYISTSSGSTGLPFYWPRGDNQDTVVGMIFHNLYENIFGTKNNHTLCVNSFALGTWIAGFELYNATKWSAHNGSKIALVTPGIDRVEAINQIKKLAHGFKRIILAGYPPFVKDIIELGNISGINWSELDVRLLTGGEAFSEMWREYVLKMIGKEPDDVASLINMYGMSETGVVGHETPTSVILRRTLRNLNNNKKLPVYNHEMSIYQYYPTARYFEVARDNSLILTSNAGLPLVRYDTRDVGGILHFGDVMNEAGNELFAQAKKSNVNVMRWQLPFVYLYGRKDLSVSLYALKIYVENIKRALEDLLISSKLSGLFIMSVKETSKFNQRLRITIELSRGRMPSKALHKIISRLVVIKLCEVNSEYRKLYASVGARALPKIKLLKYGEINTAPGRKHKWIKRH